jgi:xanthine phosphoribosyltransferase
LEERILKDGHVKGGNIQKVDSFLNHQIDVNLYEEMVRKSIACIKIAVLQKS